MVIGGGERRGEQMQLNHVQTRLLLLQLLLIISVIDDDVAAVAVARVIQRVMSFRCR